MRAIVIGLGVVAGFVIAAPAARAQAPGPERLPAPRPASGPAPVVVAPVYYPPPVHRVSAYTPWQFYGVDRQGYFRLRVAYRPGHGSFYLYNGHPYPWMTTNSLNVQPSVQGTPYRLTMPYAHD